VTSRSGLAPEQIRLLPVSDGALEFAADLQSKRGRWRALPISIASGERARKLIRQGEQQENPPAPRLIGAKEAEGGA